MDQDLYWPNLLPHAILQNTTKTRSLWNFPLRDQLLSIALLCHDLLTPRQQEFLLAYKIIILPLSVVMLISLCSILNQNFPRVFAFIRGAKRPICGTMTTIVSVLYTADIGLHYHKSLYTTAEGDIYLYTPRALLLDPFFPCHLSISLTGLAIGLHTLHVLNRRGATVTALLELAGAYISLYCSVLASLLPSTSDKFSLRNGMIFLSFMTACVTLQAIGLTWGVSLFHEIGILSARCITTLKHGVYFILRQCRWLFGQIYRGLSYVFSTVYAGVSAIITRIRSGDRVSRFLRAYILRPLIALKQSIYRCCIFVKDQVSAIITRIRSGDRVSRFLRAYVLRPLIILKDNIFSLVSFGFTSLMKFLRAGRALWTRAVYGLFRNGRVVIYDYLIPLCRFLYAKISLIYDTVGTILSSILQSCRYIWMILLLELLIPMRKVVVSVLTEVFGAVCDLVESVFSTMFSICEWFFKHLIERPVSFFYQKLLLLSSMLYNALYQFCVGVWHGVVIPLCRMIRQGCIWSWHQWVKICTHMVTIIRHFFVYMIYDILIPLGTYLIEMIVESWRILVIQLLIPMIREVFSFMWKYLFAFLLIGFGCHFWLNAMKGMAVTTLHPFSLLETCGLVLGGYVCIITGSLLLCAKCPPFFKQREILAFLTRCYQNLDFFILRFINYLLSLLSRISSSAFRSITKFISVVWKAAFDALDFLCTLAVQATRALSQGFYSHILKPIWKIIVVKGVSAIWNSPFFSFGASLTVLGVAFYCHTNDVNPHITVMEYWHSCIIPAVSYTMECLSAFGSGAWGMSLQLWDMRHNAVNMGKQLGYGIPIDNLWINAVNHSLWQLSAIPSLGWTLYAVHLCGSLLSVNLASDPKVFMRGIMKVIYYPLIASFVMSNMPYLGFLSIFRISFGKVYAIYTLISAVILGLEMKRLRAVPDVRAWNTARNDRRRRSERQYPVPSAPPLISTNNTTSPTTKVTPSAPEIPFEYLKHLPPPTTTFESTECPICMDDMPPLTDKTASTPSLCLPCGHMYHEDCVLEWLNEQEHCPSCREMVPSTSSATLTTTLIQDVFL